MIKAGLTSRKIINHIKFDCSLRQISNLAPSSFFHKLKKKIISQMNYDKIKSQQLGTKVQSTILS